MDAVEFLKTEDRMCMKCHSPSSRSECTQCPMNALEKKYGRVCTGLRSDYPEEYVAIVERWAAENTEDNADA